MKPDVMEELCRPIVTLRFERCGCKIVYSALGSGESPQGCRRPWAHRVPRVEFIEKLAEQEGYSIMGDLNVLRRTRGLRPLDTIAKSGYEEGGI